MLRFTSLVVVAGVLGGCMTTGSPTAGGGDVPVAKLQAENRSIVIVHTSMHDHCRSLVATLARPNEAGQFEAARTVVLKHTLAFNKAPSTFEVTAGEYGFIRFVCQTGNSRANYDARVAKQGSLFNGPKTTYVPIATFTVQPGEVVDIGSLRLPTREVRQDGVFELPKREFMPIIAPISDKWLQKLAETEPGLYQARIVRPMTRI